MVAIGAGCVLVVFTVATGMSPGLASGLCGPLVYWFLRMNERDAGIPNGRPPRSAVRLAGRRQQVDAEQHPLFDRWLDR
jgi:hypothetical protein